MVSISAIEANAFNARAFRQLSYLGISNRMHIIEYHADMFNGLRELKILKLAEASYSQRPMPKNVLHALHDRLKHFEYYGDIGNGPVLSNLFGGSELKALGWLRIDCRHKSKFRVIAAPNFTGLPVINVLSLMCCGIETIDSNAFDQVAETLRGLQLFANPLLQLSLNMFRYFLDYWPRRNMASKHLLLKPHYGMSYNCSLEFYRIRNATIISFHYISNLLTILNCHDVLHESNEKSNSRQQFVHPLRWHLNHSDIYIYAFRAFRLYSNAASHALHISQDDSDFYRIFMWPINSTTAIGIKKCPSTIWIRENVKCQRCSQTNETISIPGFVDDIKQIAACVIHISMRKQSVPLHCRTIRSRQHIDHFTFDWRHYAIAMLIGTSGLIVIGIVVIACVRPSITK